MVWRTRPRHHTDSRLSRKRPHGHTDQSVSSVRPRPSSEWFSSAATTKPELLPVAKSPPSASLFPQTTGEPKKWGGWACRLFWPYLQQPFSYLSHLQSVANIRFLQREGNGGTTLGQANSVFRAFACLLHFLRERFVHRSLLNHGCRLGQFLIACANLIWLAGSYSSILSRQSFKCNPTGTQLSISSARTA